MGRGYRLQDTSGIHHCISSLSLQGTQKTISGFICTKVIPLSHPLTQIMTAFLQLGKGLPCVQIHWVLNKQACLKPDGGAGMN